VTTITQQRFIATTAEAVQHRLSVKGKPCTAAEVIAELLAMRVLHTYDASQRLAHPNCVICGTAAESLDTGGDDAKCALSTLWRRAGIVEISFGFGSRFDTAWVCGVICDSCAKTFVETTAAPMTEVGPLGQSFRGHTTMVASSTRDNEEG
jgi:hypothetical protein